MKVLLPKSVNKYSRTPKDEAADLSQCHIGLNISQFQVDCFFLINSSTATKNIDLNQYLAL